VFEVYDDVTPLVVRTNQLQWLTQGVVVLLLGLLFAFLTLIGQRTFNIVQGQYEAIRRNEQILQESEEKYSNLFQQSGDGIFLLDWNGRVRDANRRIEQMLGYERDELLVMTIDQLHPANAAQQINGNTWGSCIKKGWPNLRLIL
jgi:PAS domain-containing protein